MKTDELDSSKCKTSAFSEDHIKRMKRHAREREKIFVVTYLKKENTGRTLKINSKKKKRKEKKKPQKTPTRNNETSIQENKSPYLVYNIH